MKIAIAALAAATLGTTGFALHGPHGRFEIVDGLHGQALSLHRGLHGVPADECEHRAVRTLSAPATATELLAVASGSGEVRVSGREGATAVSVEAELCASSEDLLRELDVRLDREPGRIVVETLYPEDRDHAGWWRDQYARINLVVEAPSGMPLGIDDGSGGIEVTGVGDLVIHDGSGSIDATDVRGDVRIDDGSGAVTLRGVAGYVDIEDGSGSLDLQDIGGRLTIDDGSGEIHIERVGGDVDIDDGSGEVRVYDAGGNVTVSDNSGSIIVRDVRGDFRVRHDGSGSIEHVNVAGTVDLPRSHR